MKNYSKKIIFLTILILVLNLTFIMVNENNLNAVVAITNNSLLNSNNCTHSATKENIIKNATCITVGSKRIVCRACNKTLKTVEIPKTAHNFKAKNCESPERCTVCNAMGKLPTGHPGFTKATCSSAPKCVRCGMKKGSTLPHSWENATCSRAKHCRVCNKEIGEKAEHNYVDDKCIACGAIKGTEQTNGNQTGNNQNGNNQNGGNQAGNNQTNNTVTCKKHSYSWVVTKKATCSEEGISARKCKKCDYVEKEKTIKKTKHSYKWVITEQATCEKKGLKVQICSNCNDYGESREIKITAHKYTKATCQNKKTCEVCGATTGKLASHKYTIKATCQNKKTCEICGATTGNFASHKYTIKATCTTPKQCGVCGEPSGKPTNHKYTTKVGKAYDSESHYTEYKCVCGDVTKKNVAKHKFVKNKCSCGFVAECLHNSNLRTERIYKGDKEYLLKTICAVCNEVIKEEVKTIVINTASKYSPEDFGQKKPVMNKNTYSDEDWDRMEIELKARIEAAGYGTRAAVVEAALYLASLDYALPYRGTPMQPEKYIGTYPKIGFNKTWGDSVRLTKDITVYGRLYKKGYSAINGMDCGAFVTWALVNAGVLPEGSTSYGPGTNKFTNDTRSGVSNQMKSALGSQTRAHALKDVANEVEPGDICLTYGYRNGKGAWTHVGLVVGVDSNNIYVAEENTTTYSPDGPKEYITVNKLVVTRVPKTYTGNVLGWIVLTDDKLYKAKNADGTENIGNMPIVWDY
ncbi:MAG: hypothetical protein J6C46_04840 [Clostridia bacterium]|nr:hypothetical protein [Clostridia bacterium]